MPFPKSIETNTRADVYSRVTNRIVADLAQGVRPWLKPWNADNTSGRIVRPLRANGQPYKGINVLMLWGEALVDHASYIASWLDVLKNDKRAIFTAAAHAQRAADYLHGLQQSAEATGAAA